MYILLLLVVLAVLGGIAVVAAGRGSAMPDADPDRSPLAVLPPDEVGGRDIERLRFSLAFRGYRMDEVDDVLDRLTAELDQRDARIAQLEGGDGLGPGPARAEPDRMADAPKPIESHVPTAVDVVKKPPARKRAGTDAAESAPE